MNFVGRKQLGSPPSGRSTGCVPSGLLLASLKLWPPSEEGFLLGMALKVAVVSTTPSWGRISRAAPQVHRGPAPAAFAAVEGRSQHPGFWRQLKGADGKLAALGDVCLRPPLDGTPTNDCRMLPLHQPQVNEEKHVTPVPHMVLSNYE